MKLLVLLLGYHANHAPFYLYQIPGATVLLFKLSDITTLFNVPDLARHPSLNKIPPGECYRISNDGGQQHDEESNRQQQYFLSTQVLSQAAASLNQYRLAELCKLKPNDYDAGLADSMLKSVTAFEHVTTGRAWNFMDIPLSPVVSLQHVSIDSALNNKTPIDQQGPIKYHHDQTIKCEPLSPASLRLSQPQELNDDQRSSNPMALGNVLWSKTVDRRSSTADDASSNSKRQRIDKPIHTVSSQQSLSSMTNTGQGQTLLAKRQGKNSRHLTIFAPSYADPPLVAIQSAPLNSHFPQQQKATTQHNHQSLQQPRQYHPPSNTHQNYLASTHPPKTAHILEPRHALAPLSSPHQKTAGGATGKQEFVIPPIVPSQQQPPSHHGATSALGPSHQGLFKPTRIDLANGSNTSTPTTDLQRQQFLQPFAHLFDTIETTRTLKTTLDDQIRRSSTLLQTLQVSSTTVDSLIRIHVKGMQNDMTSRLDQVLESMTKRVEQLESKLDITMAHIASIDHPTKQSPTAIVNSQEHVEPIVSHALLATLRERLDHLENQLDK